MLKKRTEFTNKENIRVFIVVLDSSKTGILKKHEEMLPRPGSGLWRDKYINPCEYRLILSF